MFKESITLYKAEGGGKSWNKLTSTEDENATIPLASKTGIIFTDSDHGWITTHIPKSGYIGLYRTMDDGDTWKQIGEQDDTIFQWSYTEQENMDQASGWSI